MKNYTLGIVLSVFFMGCTHEHQINIGDISLNENRISMLKHQEYYENKLYPLNKYCDDQRTYLSLMEFLILDKYQMNILFQPYYL